MKTLSKMTAVFVTVAMMCCVFTACSKTIKDDVLGDWTVSTINGRSCADFGASLGVAANQVSLNLKLEEERATLTGVNGSLLYEVTYTSDAIDLRLNGSPSGSLAFDKEAQTITLNDTSTGTPIQYVFTRGTTDLTAVPEESASQEGNNAGFTGADYGELTSDELQELDGGASGDGAGDGAGENNGDGINYGEMTPEELAQLDGAD